MKVPDEIVLFGYSISTRYNPTLLADRERYGEYCSRMMTITLDSNLSNQRSLLAWGHEAVEAVVDINHLEIDEQTKQAFGIAFVQLIQQAEKFREGCNQ